MDNIEQLVNIINSSSNIVAFTGAGVSTESNIPDFRSSSGLFNGAGRRYDYSPETILSHSFFTKHPDLFYEFYKNNMIYMNAKPNRCHKALGVLDEIGKLKAVITQNIDGLHQAGGCNNVLELHGTIHQNYCMGCSKNFTLKYIMDSHETVPLCDECKGIIKPYVVLYEEMLDENVLESAVSAIEKADVLIVMGTSLLVHPAAGLVNFYRGNRMILINKDSTPFDYRAKIVINDLAGKVMGEVIENLDIKER